MSHLSLFQPFAFQKMILSFPVEEMASSCLIALTDGASLGVVVVGGSFILNSFLGSVRHLRTSDPFTKLSGVLAVSSSP